MTVPQGLPHSGNLDGLFASPFLRWAGGKRWLAHCLEDFIPQTSGRYFEPFLGSGAVFFRTMPPRAFLSDSNEQLITTFKVIRDHARDLSRSLSGLRCDPLVYYQMRVAKPQTPLEIATRFIYLNRCSWNGLYRVNSLGEFNVPYGGAGRNPEIYNEKNLLAAARALSRVTLVACDFAEALTRAGSEDFVFADPPYTVTHGANGFLLYNERIFSWRDQLRLRDALVQVHDRGGLFLLTNANHPSIRRLYAGFPKKTLERSSVLAADPSRRRRVTELIISNYD